jgi:Xaa-Pro dipeptidase
LAEAMGADRLVATRGLVEQLRRTKDDDEAGLIATACRMTQEALAGVLPWIRPGRTERQIAVRLERAMVDLGADRPAFDSIVAAGANSAVPHHQPGDAPLRAGDLLKIDCGARYRGYHADMTRTFVVGAEPDARQRDMHAAVAAAAAAGRALVAPGAAAAAVDAAARRELGEWEPRFTHGLGHGLGLQIHEAPLLAARSADTIGRADVLTVEPGVYEPGFGGVRIEDTLLVTDTGAQCLTTMARDLVRLA